MAYNEKPNFEKDLKLGKIGEKIMRKILLASNKSKRVYDVSDETLFRLIDVDFVQIISDDDFGDPYFLDDVRKNLIGNGKDSSFYRLYEVKTDTVSLKSRNVVYEIISHDGAGCASNSRANYFFYVFLDKKRKPAEAWLIDTKKWRKYIRKHIEHPVSMLRLHKGGIAFNEFDKFGDHVANILTNIDIMEEKKIATRIDLNEYD